MKARIEIKNTHLKKAISDLPYVQAMIIVGLDDTDVIEVKHNFEVTTITSATLNSKYAENNLLCVLDRKIEELKTIAEKQFCLQLYIESLIDILELEPENRVQALKSLCPEGAVMPKSGVTADISEWYDLYIL